VVSAVEGLDPHRPTNASALNSVVGLHIAVSAAPRPLDGTLSLLDRQPFPTRGRAECRRLATRWRYRRAFQEREQSSMRGRAIVKLRTVRTCDDHQYPGPCHVPVTKRDQPFLDLSR